MKNVGVLGGTFDPVHIGHLILARFVKERMNLSEIWFLPANYHIFKEKKRIEASEHRLNMLKLAIENAPEFKCSDAEIRSEKISYTYNTLTELHRQYPENRFFFILGEDNIPGLVKWKNYKRLLTEFGLLVMHRGEKPVKGPNEIEEQLTRIKTPLIQISSTEIRERVKAHQSIDWLVPDKVKKYIEQNKLYLQ